MPSGVLLVAAVVSLTAAQLPSAPIDPETRFEAASIKPSDSLAVPRMSTSPGRYNVSGVRLAGIVTDAFGVGPNRMIGLPDWGLSDRYTITAKAPEGTPSTDRRAMFVMVANLLKDRFKMAMHTETRQMPVFNLVFARNDKRFGPAFTESPAECMATGPSGASKCQAMRVNPGGTTSLRGIRIDVLAQILTPYVGRPVIDKTGLTSFYNVTLKWTPDAGSTSVAPLPAGALPPDPDAPALFTALQEQLGLKLENARAPLDVVVIDHVEKPALD